MPLPPHPTPLRLSQSTSSEFPASQGRLPLTICFIYGNAHVPMLFSQIIPPSPSSIVSKVCSLYLCLFCCPAGRICSTAPKQYLSRGTFPDSLLNSTLIKWGQTCLPYRGVHWENTCCVRQAKSFSLQGQCSSVNKILGPYISSFCCFPQSL